MAGLRQLWQEAGTVRSETHCDPVFPVPFLLHSGARCQMALGTASPTLANLHRGRTASKEGMALPWDDTTTGKGMEWRHEEVNQTVAVIRNIDGSGLVTLTPSRLRVMKHCNTRQSKHNK